MNLSSEPVEVATAAPLLRVALVLLLLAAAVAGVLVAGGVLAGWLTLGFVVIAGPVVVMVDGRTRHPDSRSADVGVQVSEQDRFPSSESPARRRYRAAA
ncbi:MAG TPA: hypothetical protein VGG91_08655 [Myxococcaceae bacterium]|jgi:hypothetical protein